MHKRSFLTGLLAGIAVALLAVVAWPGLLPTRGGGDAPARATRRGVAVVNELPLPPRSPEPTAGPRQRDGAGDTRHAEETERAGEDPGEARSVRLHSYRVAAIATLRNIISAQAQFQAVARSDENRNGVGEYGSFAELSGAIGVRDGDVLNPPVLSPAFRKVERGYVERSGYRYRIYLPQRGGVPLAERDTGGFGAGEVDAGLAEACWCCYAWPLDPDEPAFFTNQAGDVLTAPAGAYAGDREPPPYAAFKDASGLAAATVIDLPEDRRIGADRQEWKPVG